MLRNRFRQVRISEGISIAELSRLSRVSQKVISETERMLRDPRLQTKHKILKGLNSIWFPELSPYRFKDIFLASPELTPKDKKQ